MHVRVGTFTLDKPRIHQNVCHDVAVRRITGIRIECIDVYPLVGPKYHLVAQIIRRGLERDLFSPIKMDLTSPNCDSRILHQQRYPFEHAGIPCSGDFSLLIELFCVAGGSELRIAWLILPCVPTTAPKKRLRFNSISATLTGDIIDLLMQRKLEIVPSSSFITLNIIYEDCSVPADCLLEVPPESEENETVACDPLAHIRTIDGIQKLPTDCNHFVSPPVASTSCASMTFSPHHPLLLAIFGKSAFIYDVFTKEYSARLDCVQEITCIHWPKEGDSIVCGCTDGILKLWNFVEGTVVDVIVGECPLGISGSPCSCMWVASRESLMYVGNERVNARHLHEKLTGFLSINYNNDSSCTCITSSAVIFANLNGVEVVDSPNILFVAFPFLILTDGKIMRTENGCVTGVPHSIAIDGVTAVTLSQDKELAAVGTADGCIRFHSSESWECIFESSITLPVPVTCITWGTSHQVLAFTGVAGSAGTSIPVVVLSASLRGEVRSWRSEWMQSTSHALGSILGHLNVSKIKERILNSILSG